MTKLTNWRERYARLLALVDASVVLWAMSGALILRFGTTRRQEWITTDGEPYIAVTVLLAAVWWIMLSLWGSRDITILGYGTEEYKRILSASFWLFGLVATVSYVFQLDTARGYVALALPAGVLSLIVARMLVRTHLRSQRKSGNSGSSVLLIGGVHGVEHLARALLSQPMAGYFPIATYLPGAPTGTATDPSLALPNLGEDRSVDAIVAAVSAIKPDAVALSSGVPLPPRIIRELGWVLAEMQVKMILAPALTDVAGPRIHTQPVAGLPLIHVSTPSLTGWRWFIKRFFDIIGSLLLILLLSPVFAIVAVCVKLTSPGPVLYSQERIGIHGARFKMLKFRSMHQNADDQLATLLQQQGTHDKPLSKVIDDPRITPAGRILRKFSLDELPQLFNVLIGDMSLVGPRPQRDHEVALYEDGAHRRLYVSPGMSGLWQVSGRSNLTWEEAIQLDLYYVENWSLTQDIVILLKTFRAVFRSEGAV
ncbi:sugar transferase [Arthrobacter sp. zg-Y826]|uniref:sugar transferase n=1 Tax=Arthrobacter jinronghuae TaxID=2964609 RepID=UPI00210767BF|nr:sugar transferase [Arthrobacter jinronghuae]MCQ1957265.1 sugar transferase [Arthrobacter jinronghuae]